MKKSARDKATKESPKMRPNGSLTESYLCDLDYNFLQEALRPFDVALSPALADSLRAFLALLLRWNRTINLVGSSDLHELLQRHIGESLFGAQLLPAAGGILCDVGSGAGFPGLMLKLARPDWSLVLIESDHRKAAFLSEAIRTLELAEARVIAERYDRLPPESPLVDVITARALGEYESLLAWARNRLRSGGSVNLWLSASDAAQLSKTRGWQFAPPLPIPESRERVILVAGPSPNLNPSQGFPDSAQPKCFT